MSATILAAWARIATDPGQRWRLTVPQKRLSRFAKTTKASYDVMTAARPQPTVGEVDADPALDVDGLTVEIRTINGTVRAVNEVSASRPAAAKPWPCSANPAAASR